MGTSPSSYIPEKKTFTNKMAHVFTAPSDRITFFVNDTNSVGSFINVKNGASEIEELRARDESEINADEYIDTDDSLFTFETCAGGGGGGGGALECNLTERCPFFKSLHNPCRKKIAF